MQTRQPVSLVTIPDRPAARHPSGYAAGAELNYRTYCELEAERLRRKGDRVAVVPMRWGKIAVGRVVA